ncbi:LysR family transcriptional regulator [Methylobacterium sp. E-065]|nr:LysR family transcriptional regulator [Methylobacterium sp. E-065]MCJ2016656.1 LysR family transcriptional regulator [Methylobacterium sp. E-065]
MTTIMGVSDRFAADDDAHVRCPSRGAKTIGLGRPSRLWSTPMDLDALALFHSVATHGGFGRAARAMRRSKTTLSRRVADLEVELGTRLFERGGATLRLTQEGRELLASTQEPLDELAAAERTFRGGGVEPRGKLRVSVPLMFGAQVMGPFAARFVARYPLVGLEVITDDRYVDVVEEGFDIAIRARPKPEEELVGRPVLKDRLVVVAPPDWTRPGPDADGKPPTVPAVVRAIGEEARQWVLDDDGQRIVIDPKPVLRLSTLIIRDAVRAGAGAALFPSFFVRDDIEAGRLAVWGTIVGEPLEFWALHASSRLASRRVRAFIDMFTQTFE